MLALVEKKSLDGGPYISFDDIFFNFFKFFFFFIPTSVHAMNLHFCYHLYSKYNTNTNTNNNNNDKYIKTNLFKE